MANSWFVMALCLLVSSASCAETKVATLSAIKDSNLNYFINNFEMMSELSDDSPYSVRLLRIQGEVDCSEEEDSRCRYQKIYAAISTYDEAPDQAVWVSPPAYRWDFVKWKSIPKKDGKSEFVVAELKKVCFIKNKEVPVTAELKFNPWNGFLTLENKQPLEARSCDVSGSGK